MSEKPNDEIQVPEEVLNLHPMVVEFFAQLVPGEDGELFSLPEPLVHDLHSAILQFEGEKELVDIIHGFTAAAITMRDHSQSPFLSEQLFAILQSPQVEEILKGLEISADPEEVSRIAERFKSFAGKEDIAKTAPKEGEKKPDGALSLDQLNFPKRL